MKFYFAPLEGITGYLYRNGHDEIFSGMDKYFTPFIVANQKGALRTREAQDILLEHNKNIFLVPQVLGNQAKDLIQLSKDFKKMGYETMNLNLGCPSKTVVTKGKGSGLLQDPDKLDRFLDQLFQESVTKISIKTRIGMNETYEFEDLIKIYNKYQLEELIIHPRLQIDYYKHIPRLELFEMAMEKSANPLCYNGDIYTVEDYEKIIERFPDLKAVMLGRGLIRNPGLVVEIQKGEKLSKDKLLAFHNRVYEGYQNTLSGDRNILFRMKELWSYMHGMFTNSEKYLKKIKKAEKLFVYNQIVKDLFEVENIK